MRREFTDAEIDRIIGMAWKDRTTFDVIEVQFGINESEVIKIMRANMKRSSFKMWRKRVSGRKTKHRAKAANEIDRFRSDQQRHRDKTY